MDITGFWGIFLFVVTPLALFVLALFMLVSKNKVQADVGQWKVVQNLSGTYRAISPQTTFLAPEWREVPNGNIPTTLQARKVDSDSVNSSDQIPFNVGYRINWLAGRAYKTASVGGVEKPGWYVFADDNPQDPSTVNERMIVRLVTSIQSGQYEEQVMQQVKAAWEAALGFITATEIAEINGSALNLPRDRNVPIDPPLPPINSKAGLYDALGKEVKLRANATLMPMGLGIDNVVVTDIDYEESDVRDARAAKLKGKMLGQAAREIANMPTDPNNPASAKQFAGADATVLAALGTKDFASVVGDRAGVDAAKAWAEAIKGGTDALQAIATALASGGAKGLVDIHDNKIGGN